MSFNMTFPPTTIIFKRKKNQMLPFNTCNHLTSFMTYKASSSNLIYEQKKKLYKNINNNLITKFYNKLIKNSKILI